MGEMNGNKEMEGHVVHGAVGKTISVKFSAMVDVFIMWGEGLMCITRKEEHTHPNCIYQINAMYLSCVPK
jgi:trans-2-enoyl-CoA reductase